MFNAKPPSDEALQFMEYVLFGWYWHPFLFFGWILAAAVVLSLPYVLLCKPHKKP